jgi:hypothetical protein
MPKKIVIAPVFCDSHLIRYQIDNIVDTIDPDYIIYNEGMFPQGPEGTTVVDDRFIEEFTLDGHRGFDYAELKQIVEDAQYKYPNTKIILNEMQYPETATAPECYYLACSNFKELGIDIAEGDLIFPFEGDVFHHEDAKSDIENYCKQLTPNTGFRSNWIDFIENQYYAEKSQWIRYKKSAEDTKSRRVCICYGTEQFYRDVLLNFMTQKYPMLYPTDLVTYHYAWWRPEKYRDLRYAQLNRAGEYWKDFDSALYKIHNAKGKDIGDVILRPHLSENLSHRYACYVDIEHPKHVKQHVNYI